MTTLKGLVYGPRLNRGDRDRVALFHLLVDVTAERQEPMHEHMRFVRHTDGTQGQRYFKPVRDRPVDDGAHFRAEGVFHIRSSL